LIDGYRGRDDLERKLIRVLHRKSFIDDATRIWRGLRYEQRLGFQLEVNTLRLLKRGIVMLDTISSDRLRHELELVLREEFPEKILTRAGELGVLAQLHPSLEGNGWLAEKFWQVRQPNSPSSSSVELYMALLVYRLGSHEIEEIIARLRLPKLSAKALRDTADLRDKLELLADSELVPSSVYHFLRNYSLTAITANLIAGAIPAARQHIQTFLTKLRYSRPSLTGSDLKKMGISPGPQMKEVLQRLRDARLDGKIVSKKGEVELVRGWLGSSPSTPSS